MKKTTGNLKLKKPDFGVKLPTGDTDLGDNFDAIDTAITDLQASSGVTGAEARIAVLETAKTALLAADAADLAVADMPSDGAIAAKQGIVKLSKTASAGAYTLADPLSGDAGKRLTLLATTAKAHVVTQASKINGDVTKPKATFGGAIGDVLVLVCLGTAGWYVANSTNVTLGA